MQGRVELMRARRKKRRRRIIVTSIVVAVVLVGALFLWRPWEKDDGESISDSDAVIDNGQTALPDGEDSGEEENGEIEPAGPTDPAELRFVLWRAGGGERAERNARFELAQLSERPAEELAVDVKNMALDMRLAPAVYYHGDAQLISSTAAALADRLGYGPPRRVDLVIVLGSDIAGLLANVPAELPGEGSLAGLRAEVLNGCGVAGVAGQTAELLRRLGVEVLPPRNYEHFELDKTTLAYAPGSIDAAEELKRVLELPGKVTPTAYDLEVILGVE